MARFLVEIPDTEGLSKKQLEEHIRTAIKAECGHYQVGDPGFALLKKRGQMKVTPLTSQQSEDIKKLWGK